MILRRTIYNDEGYRSIMTTDLDGQMHVLDTEGAGHEISRPWTRATSTLAGVGYLGRN